MGDARLAGQAQCPRRTAGDVLAEMRPRPHCPDLALAGRECQLHS
ncbi:hypothetical protein EUA04_05190 [Mycolicibacterium obuense]|uniref:Uncharacterized protein n=1 Tax=Mycolicibacterium obuense TaxID=1807 RepID=A0A4R5XD35_9MYCO|nr:hypothetical protein EUA04_05190 [Mycolicibacterium obuense]